MSDSDVEESLAQAVKLFSYLQDKDVFSEHYRNALAKRLLNGTTKVRPSGAECGAEREAERGARVCTRRAPGRARSRRAANRTNQTYPRLPRDNISIALESTVSPNSPPLPRLFPLPPLAPPALERPSNACPQNLDTERAMISKLKIICGTQFTSKMEGMLNDLKQSHETQSAFANWSTDQSAVAAVALAGDGADGTALPTTLAIGKFEMFVLTSGMWPKYTTMKVRMLCARCRRSAV